MNDVTRIGARKNGGEALATTIAPFASLSDIALGNIRRLYEALTPNRETLAVLFAVDAAQTDANEAWVTFFVETASAHLIWDERPTGHLSADDAAWVLARFDDAPTLPVLAVLGRLLEEAQHVPSWFGAEVRQRAALFGSGGGRRAAPTSARAPHLRLVA